MPSGKLRGVISSRSLSLKVAKPEFDPNLAVCANIPPCFPSALLPSRKLGDAPGVQDCGQGDSLAGWFFLLREDVCLLWFGRGRHLELCHMNWVSTDGGLACSFCSGLNGALDTVPMSFLGLFQSTVSLLSTVRNRPAHRAPLHAHTYIHIQIYTHTHGKGQTQRGHCYYSQYLKPKALLVAQH